MTATDCVRSRVSRLAAARAVPFAGLAGGDVNVVGASSPMTALGEPELVGRILDNLLNNAIKYTSPGGAIRVQGDVRGTTVTIAVRDNGVGIPAEQLPHVFEMFYQVDRSIERAHAGLGIGLYQAARQAEAGGYLLELKENRDGEVCFALSASARRR